MHKVKSFARSKAHAHGYNPWSNDSALTAAASGDPGLSNSNSTEPSNLALQSSSNKGINPSLHTGLTRNPSNPLFTGPAHTNSGQNGITSSSTPAAATADGEKPVKEKALKRFWHTFKVILFSTWVNVLLVFVPVGIACKIADINPTIVFVMNAIAIVPLAAMLSFATESVAHRLGDTIGALMNVTFGNAVELIIFIIALVKNEIRIVQASLLGSILSNLLLILGMCFLFGGLRYREQIYNSTVTQMSACLLSLSVISLLLPTAFHASFSDSVLADKNTLKLSRGTSVILLLVYVLYLVFQLFSHSYIYQSTPQHIIDEESHPGVLAHFGSSSSSSSSGSRRSSVSSSSSSSGESITGRIGRRVKRFRRKSSNPENDEKNSPPTTPRSGKETRARGSNSDLAARGRKEFREKHKHSKRLDDSAIADDVPAKEVAFEVPQAGPSNTTAENEAKRTGLRAVAPRVFSYAANIAQPNPSNEQNPQALRRANSLPPRLQSQPRDPGYTPYIVALDISQESLDKEEDDNHISRTSAVILLLASTGLVAICAEFMVSSIDHLVKTTPLSEAFVGLIILPIVGNAAEHVTAVTVAAKNKMDLAIGVAVGSSIQIALFVTPIIVLLGWILNKDMGLYFNIFETVTLFVSTFIINFLILDGRSNYLEGTLLCASYVIIAVAAFFYPSESNQSDYGAGGS